MIITLTFYSGKIEKIDIAQAFKLEGSLISLYNADSEIIEQYFYNHIKKIEIV